MVATQDQVNVGRLAVVGIAGLIFTYGLVVLLQALYLSAVESEREVKDMALPYQEAEDYAAASAAELSSFGVADPDAETLHIPLELAKERYLESVR